VVYTVVVFVVVVVNVVEFVQAVADVEETAVVVDEERKWV